MKSLTKITLFLILMTSNIVYAMDMDQAIHEQGSDASQIASTLGQPVNQVTSADTMKTVKVALIRALPKRKTHH
jgi:hypothetical protein